MLRSRTIVVALVALVALIWSHTSAAQSAKTARGTVSAVSANSINVKVGDSDMRFAADSNTTVIASGAGTKSRIAAATGQPGPKLTDLLKTGQAVIVTYREAGGNMIANEVQVVTSAGSGGGSVASETAKPASKMANGSVKSVSASSLVVTSSGKDLTFMIDGNTSVVGTGAGTKTAAAGGKIPITDLVHTGNQVSVTYNESGTMMHATAVRVTNAK